MIITKVLSEKGQEISKRETFEKLVALNSSDIYNKQKASGYIGGSNDFIQSNEVYTIKQNFTESS
jgi:hypothetical protein